MCFSFKSLDNFGPKFELSFGGKTRYQTRMGGLLTIIAYLFIMAAFGLLMNQLFFKGDVDVSTAIKYDSDQPKIDLNKYAFYPIVAIRIPSQSGKNGEFDMLPANDDYSKYFAGFGVIVELNYTDLNKGDFKQKTIDVINYVPCNKLDHELKNKIYAVSERVKGMGEQFGFCPDIKKLDEYWVKGNIVEPPYRLIQFQFFPCVRGAEELCGDKDIISNIELFILTTKFSFDPENKENPISRIAVFEENVRYNLFFSKKKILTFKQTKIYDDSKDFGDPEFKTEFQDVDKSSLSYALNSKSEEHVCNGAIEGDCVSLVTLELQADKKIVHIVRTYPKIFGVLGEFGGVVEIVITAASLLYLVYTCTKFDRTLAKKVYKGDVESINKAVKEKNLEEVKRSMGKILEEDKNIMNIFKQLSYARVMRDALLKPHEKELLPLVLTNVELRKDLTEGRNKKKTVFSEGRQGADYSKEVQKLKSHVPENQLQEDVKKYFLEHLPDSILNAEATNENDKGGIELGMNLRNRNNSKFLFF